MKPKTRFENFLAKIAKDEDAKEIMPRTRVEHYLNEIALNGGGGGGDCNVFLVHAELDETAEVEEGDPIPLITDKTYSEITAALDAGDLVVVDLLQDDDSPHHETYVFDGDFAYRPTPFYGADEALPYISVDVESEGLYYNTDSFPGNAPFVVTVSEWDLENYSETPTLNRTWDEINGAFDVDPYAELLTVDPPRPILFCAVDQRTISAETGDYVVVTKEFDFVETDADAVGQYGSIFYVRIADRESRRIYTFASSRYDGTLTLYIEPEG